MSYLVTTQYFFLSFFLSRDYIFGAACCYKDSPWFILYLSCPRIALQTVDRIGTPRYFYTQAFFAGFSQLEPPHPHPVTSAQPPPPNPPQKKIDKIIIPSQKANRNTSNGTNKAVLSIRTITLQREGSSDHATKRKTGDYRSFAEPEFCSWYSLHSILPRKTVEP